MSGGRRRIIPSCVSLHSAKRKRKLRKDTLVEAVDQKRLKQLLANL